jgi:hypothetical protein
MQIMEDGDTVYFVPGRTGDSIWRGSLRTGAASKVVDRLLPGCWGSWAAGKRAIYYLGRNVAESGRAWVMRRDLRSGQDAAVAAWEGMIPPMGTSYWSFTPDERWIYVVRGDRSSSDIEVVEPFR